VFTDQKTVNQGILGRLGLPFSWYQPKISKSKCDKTLDNSLLARELLIIGTGYQRSYSYPPPSPLPLYLQ